ncbi:MAG: PAS domain-containing sensor histidine kinase [Archaeoglobales archaeon]|nr:PAS domain-containing sensor histidine kinase [Archaeoglobales archaeon]
MELKNSEEFLRTLVDESLAPIYILQSGKMVYVNKSFEEVTGYKVEEILGREPFFIVHPEDRRGVYERYLAREAGKLGTETYSFKIITKHGVKKWITVRPSRIIYNGKPAVAATAIDTTELHEIKSKLEKRNEYLRFLNKILRHDIANALTFVRFALEDKEDEISKKAVERIDHIVRLINDVRTLEAALDELIEIRLDKVVEDVAKSYDVNFKVEEVSVLANNGLYSVVDNLIRNAIVHGGGEVEVEVLKENENGVLRVKDRGKGVPKEIREKIFEEGFTTGKGTGIGLYIVKKLVEIYGGEIKVYDNVPHGAIFEVRLKVINRQA